MRILVTGSTGMVGSALGPSLRAHGHDVVPLVRHPVSDQSAVPWDPARGELEVADLEDVDAVVHLAGENVGTRWSDDKKRAIRDSRVNGTRLLAERLTQTKKRAGMLVCASAIGFYGNRGDEILTDDSSPGDGFFPDVCTAWEDATQAAERSGIRVVHLRFGMILSSRGGALGKLLSPFKLGLGGRVGNGAQWWSWISLHDAVRAIEFALDNSHLNGAYNTASPEPVTNLEFTRALGESLHRPTPFPFPESLARLVFGEMADATLLSSTRVQPAKLLAAGFQFHHVHLADALRAALQTRM